MICMFQCVAIWRSWEHICKIEFGLGWDHHPPKPVFNVKFYKQNGKTGRGMHQGVDDAWEDPSQLSHGVDGMLCCCTVALTAVGSGAREELRA